MQKKVTLKRKEEKFEWTQSEESVTISFPIRNVLMKNVDVVTTDLLLKVNVSSIRFFAVVDFDKEIEWENPKNKTQLLDSSLEVYLIKKIPEMWENILVQGLSKEELTARRNESLERYYKREAERLKDAK